MYLYLIYMYIYIYICVRVCIYTRMYIHAYIYTYAYMCKCICMHKNVYWHKYAYSHPHKYIVCLKVSNCTLSQFLYIYVCIQTLVSIHICIHFVCVGTVTVRMPAVSHKRREHTCIRTHFNIHIYIHVRIACVHWFCVYIFVRHMYFHLYIICTYL